MPIVRVCSVPSTGRPTVAGEPGLAAAATVGNAVFAASEKRVRRLPIRHDDQA